MAHTQSLPVPPSSTLGKTTGRVNVTTKQPPLFLAFKGEWVEDRQPRQRGAKPRQPFPREAFQHASPSCAPYQQNLEAKKRRQNYEHVYRNSGGIFCNSPSFLDSSPSGQDGKFCELYGRVCDLHHLPRLKLQSFGNRWWNTRNQACLTRFHFQYSNSPSLRSSKRTA